MASLSGIGGYSQAARKGMGGLMSGLDTDELVKGMTTNTRAKIAKMLQNKTSISWKMDAYRGLSKSLIDFSDKYMSYTSSTNIFSDKFFDNTTVTALGDNAKYISVTGNASMAKNLSIVGIDSVAARTRFSADSKKHQVSSGEIVTGEIDFKDKIVSNLGGESFNIAFNGKIYTAKVDVKANPKNPEEIAQAMNDAMKSVKIDGGGSLADKISFETGTDKDGKAIVVAKGIGGSDEGSVQFVGGSSAEAYEAMGMKVGFSVKADGGEVKGSFVEADQYTTTLTQKDSLVGQSFNFSYNGVQRSISLGSEEIYTMSALQKQLQGEMDKNFGNGRVTVGVDGNKLSFKTTLPNGQPDPTSNLTLNNGSTKSLMGEKGFLNIENGLSTKLNIYNPLKDAGFGGAPLEFVDGKGKLNINGIDFEYSEDDTIKSLMDKINSSNAGVKMTYLATTDTFDVEATQDGASGKIKITDATGNLATKMFGKEIDSESTDPAMMEGMSKGTDAQIRVKFGNGSEQTIVRGTNVFDIDGVTVTLGPDAGKFDPTKPITFNGKTNTDDMVKGIKSMVDDYNALIEKANKELTTKKNRNYAPLTDEQKSEMTDKQIEEWEKQAKAGILFGDLDVRSLTGDLRFIFNNQAFKDAGITTSSIYSENGKIKLDETKLKKALEENPDEVKKLFINPKDPTGATQEGAMSKLKGVVEKYAGTTGIEKGIFVKKAGLEDSITTLQSTMYKDMDDIDKTVTALKRTLLAEEDRYYRQFTALEQYVSQMNSQSSWLFQQS